MIEKSVPRITVWHHEACRAMTNADREVIGFWFQSRGLLTLLTIHRHFGQLGHVVEAICINCGICIVRNLYVKFELK